MSPPAPSRDSDSHPGRPCAGKGCLRGNSRERPGLGLRERRRRAGQSPGRGVVGGWRFLAGVQQEGHRGPLQEGPGAGVQGQEPRQGARLAQARAVEAGRPRRP
eukprot:3473480-Alexandrium_andersonii.AAC.1